MQEFFMKSLSVKIPKSACEKWMDFSRSMKNKKIVTFFIEAIKFE